MKTNATNIEQFIANFKLSDLEFVLVNVPTDQIKSFLEQCKTYNREDWCNNLNKIIAARTNGTQGEQEG